MITTPDSASPTPSTCGFKAIGLPIAAGMVVFLVVVGGMTGLFFEQVLVGTLLDGAVLTAYLVSACGWGWGVVGRSPARGVTVTSIGLGWMGLLTLFLGLAGSYTVYTAWGMVAFGVVLGLTGWLRGRREGCVRSDAATSVAGRIGWVVVFVVVLSAAWVCVSIMPGFLWKPMDPHPYDVLSYHLQIPREWYQAGRIIPLTHNAFSYFPMGMEMHYLAAMTLRGGPWAGMYLCQMMTLAHGVLTVLAVGHLACALGATPIRAWSGSLLVTGVPWVFQLSVVAYVETGVMLYTTLAVGWLLLGIRTGNIRAWWIVGICCGFACGIKYTAIPMTALLVVMIVLVQSSVGRRFARVIIVLLACVVVASPWLIRNTVWTGNPVFPLATNLFGSAHFTQEQVSRYRAAHSPTDEESGLSARISNGWTRTLGDPQFGYVIWIAGAGAVLFLMIRKTPTDGIVLGTMILGMLAIWIGATHVVPRFITPVVPLLGLAVALIPLPGLVAVGLAGLNLLIGGYLVGGWLVPVLDLARQGLFRVSTPELLMNEQLESICRSGKRIALIGDAQAFFYPVDAGRLIYRTVFDVRIPRGVSLVDGWLGESVDSLRKRGVWVVIHPAELQRLSRTYRELPSPSPPFDNPNQGLIILGPE